jgi:hypothetical protein
MIEEDKEKLQCLSKQRISWNQVGTYTAKVKEHIKLKNHRGIKRSLFLYRMLTNSVLTS